MMPELPDNYVSPEVVAEHKAQVASSKRSLIVRGHVVERLMVKSLSFALSSMGWTFRTRMSTPY
jgi:hypothetical protein